jgi:hypothetical protein
MLFICGPLYTFLGPIGGAQMTKKGKKAYKKLFSGCSGAFGLSLNGPKRYTEARKWARCRTKPLIKSLGLIY